MLEAFLTFYTNCNFNTLTITNVLAQTQIISKKCQMISHLAARRDTGGSIIKYGHLKKFVNLHYLGTIT